MKYIFGPNLQNPSGGTHEVLKSEDKDPRLSLTLRYLGNKQPIDNELFQKDSYHVVNVNSTPGNYIGVKPFDFHDELMKEQFDIAATPSSTYKYIPDIAKFGSKVYTNGGRMCMTIELVENINDCKIHNYKYGGKKVKVVATTLGQLKEDLPYLARCFEDSSKDGLTFNWIHCTLYPNGGAGLAAHQDNEASIAKDSIIAGYVVGSGRRIRMLPLK